MEIQKLLNQIIDDATKAANEYYTSANARISEIKKSLSDGLEEKKQDLERQLNSDMLSLKERTSRMYELENKKHLLSKKQEIIKSCFDEAEVQFKNLDSQKIRSYFRNALLSNLSGGEKVMLCEESKEFLNSDFIDEINTELQKNGKQRLILDESFLNGFGLCVIQQGVEMHLTSSAIINENRFSLEQKVAEILFEN